MVWAGCREKTWDCVASQNCDHYWLVSDEEWEGVLEQGRKSHKSPSERVGTSDKRHSSATVQSCKECVWEINVCMLLFYTALISSQGSLLMHIKKHWKGHPPMYSIHVATWSKTESVSQGKNRNMMKFHSLPRSVIYSCPSSR